MWSKINSDLNLFMLSSILITQNAYLDIFFASSGSSSFTLNGPSAQLSLDAPLNNFNGLLKITDKSATSITQTATANKIFFTEGGRYEVGDGIAKIVGTLDTPAGNPTDEILLNGNKILDVEFGAVNEDIKVSGTGNKLRGRPLLQKPIVLADASTELDIGIDTSLDQNIVLNGGKIILNKSLNIADGASITGNGTIDIGGHSLTYPVNGSIPAAGDIEYLNANDVTVRVNTTRSGNWTFSQAGESSTIRGWGVILDLSPGGKIRVRNGHTLYINNLHIKGIGANGGNIEIEDGSIVYLTNTTLQLDGNLTVNDGKISVIGDGCNIVAKGSDQIVIDTANGFFEVDGVVLRYDSLNEVTHYPLLTTNGGTLTTINSGVIKSGTSTSAGNTDIDGTSSSTSENLDLTSESVVTVTNATPATPKAVTLDSAGNYMNFSDGSNQPLVIEENVTLTIENTVVTNFDPSKVSRVGVGATQGKLKFGAGTVLKIDKNLSLTSDPITIAGNATIEGNSSNIIELGSQQLFVEGANTATLKGMVIRATAADSLKCNNASGKISLQKTDLLLTSAGLTFDTGVLEVNGDVRFSGADQTGAGGGSKFSFTSAGSLDIKTGSKLKIDKGTSFRYNPDITGDGGDPAVQKRHFTLADASSVLELDNATFETGPAGMALDYGNLVINGKTQFKIDSGAGKELELGSALQIDIGPSGSLDVDGAVKYNPTVHP